MNEEGGDSVLLTISGTDEDGESVRMQTRGLLRAAGEAFVLDYEEAAPDGIASVRTLLDCREGRVTLLRMGGVITTLTFALGETFLGEYQTPYGTFTLRLLPSTVEYKRRGRFGRVQLGYQYELAGEGGMRRLDVRFKPCP